MTTNTVQDAVLAGIKTVADEITKAEKAASGVVEGLTLLKELSNEKDRSPWFSFNSAVKDGTTDVVITTNIPNGGKGSGYYADVGSLEIIVDSIGRMQIDGKPIPAVQQTEEVLKTVAQKATLHKMIKI